MNKAFRFFFGIVSVSPVLFLLGLAASFALYMVFPRAIVAGPLAADIFLGVGILLIIGGTTLAFAAQKVSRVVTNPKYKATCPDLMQGPYRYSRHPGTLSLIVMYVGFALIVNSLVMALAAVVFTLLLSLVFVPVQERVIGSLCPEAYAEYKSKVRMWL